MSMRSVPKPKNVYDQRVPKSEKYKHITGRLDTGLTVEKVKFITVREFSRRRDEIYFRVNKDMLANLFEEYESDEKFSLESKSGPRIMDHGEHDREVYDRPYLLLDCRETDNYNTNHLLQARSYPYQMLRRDQLHPDIYQFRNKEEHLIICYCDNEVLSRDVCKTLVDRGIENTFLLTGGFVEFAAKFPQFVEGAMPDIQVSPSRAPSRKVREKREFLDKLKSEGSRTGSNRGRGHMSVISEIDNRSERGSRLGEGSKYGDRRSEHGGDRATGERRGSQPEGFGFHRADLESTTPRKAYSQSTLGSPNMSDRVRQALEERRIKLSASRGGSGMNRLDDDLGSPSDIRYNGKGPSSIHNDRSDDRDKEKGFSENIRGLSERMKAVGGSGDGDEGGNHLNSARLRAHEERTFDRDEMDRASSRGGRWGFDQREDRGDYDDESRMTCRSSRSVANSIISKASAKRGTGRF